MRTETLFIDQNPHARILLGLYISRKRRELGFSVQEIASRLEISPQAFRGIERGTSIIKATVFCELESILSLEERELCEIRRISGVAHINYLAEALSVNFPA